MQLDEIKIKENSIAHFCLPLPLGKITEQKSLEIYLKSHF